MEKQTLQISWGTIVRFFAIAIIIGAIYFFRDLIALFLSAVIIATVIEAPIATLTRKRIPRFAAVSLIYLGSLLLLTGFFYIAIPILISEFEGFSQTLINLINRGLRADVLLPEAIAKINLFEFLQNFGPGAGTALKLAYHFVGGIFSLILVFVVSFYVALQGRAVERLIRVLSPAPHEAYFLGLWQRAERKISRWFYGQVVLSLAVGLPVFIGLWILGVNYAFLIGVIAALFEIVPVVGPIISGLVAIVVAVQQGTDIALYTLILFIVIQQVENNLLVPAVMKRSIGLNPVVIVFALLIGGKLAGLWGIMLAVPVTAALSEFLEDWEKKRLPRASNGS